jgi:hypothetical protein
MAKKEPTEKPSKVKYEDIKPSAGLKVNREKYLLFLDIYHYLRPYLERELPQLTKKELIAIFPKDKTIAANVWDCVYELKLKWPDEMVGIVFEL